MSKPLQLTIHPRLEDTNLSAEEIRQGHLTTRRLGLAKRLTDPELAAEVWMLYWGSMPFMWNGKANTKGKSDRQRTMNRFATLPHFDEVSA